ncbi:Uncharacterized protein TCM_002898 [Theobroma cacao]|uniref:Uncharacterized protein n=1 Tax=Theobroma cacao TaxID=3641 RepID=A0A061DN88_THECC|nr:Uncharacterized protein TCM_002898 [Theobroma cacao]
MFLETTTCATSNSMTVSSNFEICGRYVAGEGEPTMMNVEYAVDFKAARTMYGGNVILNTPYVSDFDSIATISHTFSKATTCAASNFKTVPSNFKICGRDVNILGL